MKEDRVSIGRCPELDDHGGVLAILRRTLNLIDAEEKIQNDGLTVIKPNVCWGENWRTGATTSPMLIEGVVHWLRENGAEDIVIAEGSMVGHDTMACYESTGIEETCSRLGVPLVDLNREEKIRVKVPDHKALKEIEIARCVLEAGCLVNMPVMKTHINTMVTLSIKNLKGVIDHKWKKRFHFVGLDSAIADLYSIVKQDIVVLDGLIGQQGQGPLTGDPANAGIIMASTDPLAIDWIASIAMGFDPKEVGHLCRSAEKRGVEVGSYLPRVVGTPLNELGLHFDKPDFVLEGRYDGVEIMWGDPCSGCAGALSVALDRLSKSGHLRRVEEAGSIEVALGPKAKPKGGERVVLIGKCQYRNRKRGIFVPGCPPPGTMVKDVIGGLLGLERKYDDDEMLEEALGLYDDDHTSGGEKR